jgi:hypothetical protein
MNDLLRYADLLKEYEALHELGKPGAYQITVTDAGILAQPDCMTFSSEENPDGRSRILTVQPHDCENP